jgi:hypothetical protein
MNSLDEYTLAAYITIKSSSISVINKSPTDLPNPRKPEEAKY